MGVAVYLWDVQHSLDAAFHVVAGPLDTSSVSLQLELVLASLAALEPKNAAVFAYKHHAGAGFDFFAGKVANSSFWHLTSPCVEFASLSTRVLEHQNVAHSNGTDDVSADDAANVPRIGGVVDTHLDLRGFPGHTGSSDDFDHFCWPSTKFFTHDDHLAIVVQAFLRPLISSTTSWNFSCAPLVISITATEAAEAPLARPTPLARNSWLGT